MSGRHATSFVTHSALNLFHTRAEDWIEPSQYQQQPRRCGRSLELGQDVLRAALAESKEAFHRLGEGTPGGASCRSGYPGHWPESVCYHLDSCFANLICRRWHLSSRRHRDAPALPSTSDCILGPHERVYACVRCLQGGTGVFEKPAVAVLTSSLTWGLLTSRTARSPKKPCGRLASSLSHATCNGRSMLARLHMSVSLCRYHACSRFMYADNTNVRSRQCT